MTYFVSQSRSGDAAIKAGYSENCADEAAYKLMKNPKVLAYYQQKSNEVNRAYKVSHSTFIKDLALAHNKLDAFNTESAIKGIAPLLNIKGKATGMFSVTNYNVNVNQMAKDAKLAEIKRIEEINKERIAAKNLIEGTSEDTTD